jgi:hypothetical protein
LFWVAAAAAAIGVHGRGIACTVPTDFIVLGAFGIAFPTTTTVVAASHV